MGFLHSGRVPYLVERGFLAFFTVVASIQIFPQRPLALTVLSIIVISLSVTFAKVYTFCVTISVFVQNFILYFVNKGINLYLVLRFSSSLIVFFSRGCVNCGAISLIGMSTKSRICSSGWGTVSRLHSIISSP